MNKCPKCGTEFSGGYCPNCGEKWEEEKVCPNCGAKLHGSARFCNDCGFGFYGKARSAQSGFGGWVKVHKKLVVLLAFLFLAVLALSIGIPIGMAHRHDGTYYSYDCYTETYNPSDYYRLDGNKLIDAKGNAVEVKFDGDEFRAYTEFFGEQVIAASGVVKDGVMRLSVMGIRTYAKKGHEHKYGWKTIKEPTCINREEVGECLCGKQETREIAGTGHQFENGTCTVCGESLLRYESIEGGYAIVDCDHEISGDLVIPATYSGKLVISIGEEAFRNCDGLTSVSIPNSVTSIGGSAFERCRGLTSVVWNAENCTKVGINNPIFEDCTNLKSVTFGEKVKIIPSYAFGGCSGLTSVTIPDSVTSIGFRAFYDCDGLTNVTIGNGVTSIGESAFAYCRRLTSIEVAQGNPIYHSDSNCLIETATQTLILGCKTSNIPDSVTSIGEAAFKGCSGLTSVTIPNSVTSIRSSAFEGCSGLTSVTIGNGVTSIGHSAFEYRILLSIYYKGTPIQWSAIRIDDIDYGLSNATLYYYSSEKPTEEQWQEAKHWWRYDPETNRPKSWLLK